VNGQSSRKYHLVRNLRKNSWSSQSTGKTSWLTVSDLINVVAREVELYDTGIVTAHPPMATAAPTTGSVVCATRTATPSWSPAPTEPPTAP